MAADYIHHVNLGLQMLVSAVIKHANALAFESTMTGLRLAPVTAWTYCRFYRYACMLTYSSVTKQVLVLLYSNALLHVYNQRQGKQTIV